MIIVILTIEIFSQAGKTAAGILPDDFSNDN